MAQAIIQPAPDSAPFETKSGDPLGDRGPQPGPSTKTGWIIPTLLCLLFVGQCAWFINTQSLSNDEPLHMIAGLEAWRYHRFERWNDHPPLVFLLCTLPLLANHTEISIQPDAKYADAITPRPEAIAWAARPVVVMLGVLLGVLLWMTARRLFSEGAANFALALFAFSPSLIANFSITCNDGALALITFVTALQVVYWRRTQSWGRSVALGLVLGALLATKFSTPVIFILAVGLVLVLKPAGVTWKPRGWNWRKALAMIAIAFLFVWGTYFFHWTKVTVKDGFVTVTSPNRTKATTGDMHRHLNLTVYLPAGEYVEGMGRVANHLNLGHPTFFLGQVSIGKGWKSYFPVVVLLKWPTVVLAIFLTAVVLGFLRRIQFPPDLLILSLFPALYFLLAIFSKVDLGERHILLVYPFALLYAAALWHAARQRRAILALLVALVVVNAADTLRYGPGTLSYFNVFVKPATSYKLLSDSNLDWGQGLLALRKYQAEHPSETIHLAYFGTMDPALYGIRYVPLAPNERVSGTVVVSATHLSGQLLDDPNGYHWALEYPRAEILDHALHVFRVPEQKH
jgi:4-amino-4-deoxy-L-arabinose transferase-like glycosyltransferase